MNERAKIQNAFSGLEVSPDILREVQNMKSMNEIMEMTGLKEKQIGLYVQQNLIHPAAEAEKHMKMGGFLEHEVAQMLAVVRLRVHEFGIDEIKYLTICGDSYEEYLKQKSEKKRVIYENMDDVHEAISVLQANKPDGKELDKLRKEIRHCDFLPKEKDYKPGYLERHAAPITLTAIMAILLVVVMYHLPALAMRVMVVLALMGIAGLLCLAMGIVYVVRRKPGRKYVHSGTAKIRKLSRDTGFDISFGLGKSIVPGSGFSEQGRGGIWQIVFMFWNEIRPDNWFPVVTFSHNGQERLGTFRFGGFRRTWKEGAEVEILWSDEDTGLVHPKNTGYMLAKAGIAFILAVLLGGIALWKVGPVYRAANSPFAENIATLSEVLGGYEETYDGTIDRRDHSLEFQFVNLSGMTSEVLHCKAGDCLSLDVFPDHASTGDGGIFRVAVYHNSIFLAADDYEEGEQQEQFWTYHIREDGDYEVRLEGYKGSGWVNASTLTEER